MNGEQKPETVKSYKERMLVVLLYIQEHLSEALQLEELASLAYFSPFHFHRIFRGMIGESVHQHIRRLRLERAAHQLKFSDVPITRIAFDAGFEAHEAFTRAFRAMFDDSPTGFRQTHRTVPVKNVPSGIHYMASDLLTDFESSSPGVERMRVTIERVDPFRVLFMRHTGPYDEVDQIWQQLFAWAGRRGLVGPSTQMVAVTYDDPDITPPERLRCDACLVIGQSIEPEGPVALQQIGGGDYAATRHTGPYDRLADTYARLCGTWLPSSGREARSAPALEFYRNSPTNTSPEELITDIHLPLVSLS